MKKCNYNKKKTTKKSKKHNSKHNSKHGGSSKSKSKSKSTKKYSKISRKDMMLILLRRELNKRFCKCVKNIKYGKNKVKKGSEYPICYKSIYINRGIKPPKNVIKTCKRKKTKK